MQKLWSSVNVGRLKLNHRLAYLHVMLNGNNELLQEIRSIWSNALLVNRPGRPLEQIAVAVVTTIGEWALANPDFVERLKIRGSLNKADSSTFYGGGSHGYPDYPTLAELVGKKG